MPLFTEGENVEPLTAAEKKWCRDLETLFAKMPPRFGIYTTGDPYLGIFDIDACERDDIPQEECEPQRRGYDLASIAAKTGIQGWCG